VHNKTQSVYFVQHQDLLGSTRHILDGQKDSHGKKRKKKETSNTFALPSACNDNYGHNYDLRASPMVLGM